MNSDRGWAGALNEDVTIYADRPFRIRFEVRWPSGSMGAQQFRLQYRRNEGEWTDLEAHDFPKPDARTPRVSIVSCAAYENGAATTDLWSGSAAGFGVPNAFLRVGGPFQPGTGVSLADRTPAWAGAGARGEFEWALVVRRYADGPVTNEEGDTFEFRMVEADGPGGRRPQDAGRMSEDGAVLCPLSSVV